MSRVWARAAAVSLRLGLSGFKCDATRTWFIRHSTAAASRFSPPRAGTVPVLAHVATEALAVSDAVAPFGTSAGARVWDCGSPQPPERTVTVAVPAAPGGTGMENLTGAPAANTPPPEGRQADSPKPRPLPKSIRTPLTGESSSCARTVTVDVVAVIESIVSSGCGVGVGVAS